MNPTFADPWLSLLRDPLDQAPLTRRDDQLVSTATGRSYAIVEDIPVLLPSTELGPLNQKYQRAYDWMCYGYDLASTIGNWVMLGRLNSLRRQLAAVASIKSGDCCLFTSIGTGADIPFLAERVPLDSIRLVGLDLSRGMLRRCQRRLVRMHSGALLVQANAEQLPFAAGTFDSVVHVGGINFFDHPRTAVEEMVRVAKPGTLLVIVDETPKVVEKGYRRIPVVGREFADAPTNYDPKSWVPGSASDVRYEIVANGNAYLLTFRTAMASA